MRFPAPKRWYLHPFRCFWVAVWNTHDCVPWFLPNAWSPFLFGRALGQRGRRVG